MKISLGFLFLCGLCPVLTSGTEPNKALFKKIQPLVGHAEIEQFKKEPHIRVIYYYKSEFKNKFKLFLRELDKSVEFLELYNVRICMVDCGDTANKDVTECGKPKSERNVFTYRGGIQLLQLELETMFDVNSIMSNLLQLVLLREVPIFQTSHEIETFLGRQREKQDVVFGYMKAIGTFDHRVFMEIAYAYQGKLKFALCTNKKATKVFDEPVPSSDASTIWWVWTKDMKPRDKHFPSIQYDGPLKLAEFARYVKYITQPLVFSIPSDGMTSTHDATDLNIVTIRYRTNRETEVKNIAEMIGRHLASVVGVVIINMDDSEASKLYKCKRKLPAVSLTKKGENEELFYEGDFHLELLFKFLDEHIAKPKQQDEFTGEEVDDDDDKVEAEEHEFVEIIDEVERQDDKVAFAVSNTKKVPMLLDLVPALTDKTFESTINAGPIAVVLFYFPLTAVNSVSLRYFGEASDRLGKQTSLMLARVSCYDWTDVCQKENIDRYPTLRIYKHGKMAWDYMGPQDPQEMFSMLKILELSSPRQVVDPVEVMTYIVGQGETDIAKVTNTTVVGLFDKKSSKEMALFKKVGEESRDRIMFVYTDDETATKIAQQFGCEVPCIILSKFDDAIQPHVIFDGQYRVDDIQSFIQQNKLPKLTELTPLMFPQLRKQGDSMVILFTDESTDSLTAKDDLRKIVKAEMFSNVSFTVFPTLDQTGVAYKVLQVYTAEPTVPFLSYVDFKKGEVFNFDHPSFNRENMVHWLGSVVKGTSEPSVHLSSPEWKPLNKGYEFLKVMDHEAEQEKRKQLGEKLTNGDAILQDQIDNEEFSEPVMEDMLDADTRKDLFKSRLYHVAPGRSNKQETTRGHDEL